MTFVGVVIPKLVRSLKIVQQITFGGSGGAATKRVVGKVAIEDWVRRRVIAVVTQVVGLEGSPRSVFLS